MIRQHLAILLFTLVSLVAFNKLAMANGAVFERGSESGNPMPVKQSELYLKKEHVVFRNNEVIARFWVQNPSDKDISVTMGFPLFYGPYFGQKDNNLSDQERIQFVAKINSVVSITSQGKPFKLEMKEQEKGPYRVTFLWEMTYPAGKLTEFTVKYPMDRNWHSADGLGEHSEFVYITHTGASWARPIEDAVFEYHDKELVNFITSFYPGFWWEDENTELEVKYVVSPQPYKLDLEEGKIIWHRANWVPRKNKDDIRVAIHWKYKVGAPNVDTHTNDPSSFGLLCGDTYPEDSDRSQHFAETIKLETVKFDNKSFRNEVFYKAQIYRERDKAYPTRSDHMRLASELEVLKYLRNYIASRHGHEFKNEELAECYRNVKAKRSWNDAEKENLQFIQELEKALTKEHKEALNLIKDEMLDMNLFRKAMFGWKYPEEEDDLPDKAEKKRASE